MQFCTIWKYQKFLFKTFSLLFPILYLIFALQWQLLVSSLLMLTLWLFVNLSPQLLPDYFLIVTMGSGSFLPRFCLLTHLSLSSLPTTIFSLLHLAAASYNSLLLNWIQPHYLPFSHSCACFLFLKILFAFLGEGMWKEHTEEVRPNVNSNSLVLDSHPLPFLPFLHVFPSWKSFLEVQLAIGRDPTILCFR